MPTRIDIFRKTLNQKNIDAFLVSDFYNILYLSGFKTLVDNEREAWFLVTKNNVYLFTDGRYRAPSNILRLITPEHRLTQHLKEIIEKEGIKTLGIEGDDLKFSEYQAFKNNLKAAKIITTERLIIAQRQIKDADEIEKIKEACEIIDRCLTEIVPTIKVGAGEKEIAFKIEFWLKNKGYAQAFYPIVAVDKNSAVPHYDTKSGNNIKIKNSSIILIDAGARVKDYNSDITRMFFVGKPKTEMLNAYNQLLDIQAKAVEKLNKEKFFKNIDSFCRQQLSVAGFPSYSHSTGHGIGLQVHEYPKLSAISEDRITPNQVVTVEPGIYFSGRWGMRIEDTVLIKEEGVEALTKFPSSFPSF